MKLKTMILLNQKGNALLFAVIAITSIAVLGTGIYFMTSTATFSGLAANDQNRAYQLALAGRDYALAKNLPSTAGTYYTFANGDKFRLEIGQGGNPDEIKSTGIVKEGTPYEAKHTITITKTGFASQADVSFAKDIQSFTTPAATKADLITTDTGTGQITLGQIGDVWKSQFGALWYKGNAASGNCKDGRCEFGTGFRAFFVFKINASTAGADGFTFTAFNGDTATNDFYSVGGDLGRGELLGYSGDSRLDAAGTTFLDYNNRQTAGFPTPLGNAKGRGIQPPKLAVEFDPYINSGGDITDYCATNNSRLDGQVRHHVGYVFWGTNDSCTTMTTVGKNSCDDNKHNTGTDTLTDPRNSRRPSDGEDTGYYNAPTLSDNWLTSGVYAYRIEVTRSKNLVDGGYEYTMKSWIKPCTDLACTTYVETSSFANTKEKYDDTIDTANLTRIDPNDVKLTGALHDKFNTFFFGWTMATGGATEEVKIARFRINFQK